MYCSRGHSPAYLSPRTWCTPYCFNSAAYSPTTASGENGGHLSRTQSTTATPSSWCATATVKLSLDPPLVLVCVARDANSHDALVAAPGFAVHILGSAQDEVSRQFAEPGPLKFEDYPDQSGPFDVPLLPFGVALLVCAHHSALDGGDHTILLGRVVDTDLAGTDPLVYCNRGYWRISAST